MKGNDEVLFPCNGKIHRKDCKSFILRVGEVREPPLPKPPTYGLNYHLDCDLTLKPGTYLKNVVYFSKQYTNPETRLQKLGLD
jgi:hypothetical protein